MKLKRIPGSTNSRIVSAADDKDIGQVSDHEIVYPNDLAQEIVGSVNSELKKRQCARNLKALNLSSISRGSDVLRTSIRFEDYDIRGILSGPWLEFGECWIQNGGSICQVSSPIRDDITDFAHDTAWVVRIDLVGFQYIYTRRHVTYFRAYLTPDPKDILIHSPDFIPEKVEGAIRCSNCQDNHLILPEDYYVPPVYELAHVVAGKQVSIVMGGR